MLAQQDMTIDEFEADLKRQMLITRLRDVAIEGTIVTPPEIEQEYRKKKNEQIKIQYVKITQDKFKKEVEPSRRNAEVLQDQRCALHDPEKQNLVVLVADQAKIEQAQPHGRRTAGGVQPEPGNSACPSGSTCATSCS